MKTVRISYIGEQGDTTGMCCQQIKISHPQTLILIRDFNYSGMSWKGSKAEHKQLRSCLECGKIPVINGPTRYVLLDLLLTNEEKLARDVKANGSLGCSYHELVEFRMLREAR